MRMIRKSTNMNVGIIIDIVSGTTGKRKSFEFIIPREILMIFFFVI